MVDERAQDIMDYVDNKACSDIFGTTYPRGRYPLPNYSTSYWDRGILGKILLSIKDGRMKGLKRNKFISKGKRRAHLESPETQMRIGKRFIEKYLERNKDIDLHYWASTPDMNEIIKRELCLGKYISPATEEGKIEAEMRDHWERLAEEFEKIRTSIMCGTEEKPGLAVREFIKYVESEEWLKS